MRTSFSQLRRVRMIKGLSQAEVSRRTGINYADVSRIETGLIKPNSKRKALLSRLFGVPEELLFPFIDKDEK